MDGLRKTFSDDWTTSDPAAVLLPWKCPIRDPVAAGIAAYGRCHCVASYAA